MLPTRSLRRHPKLDHKRGARMAPGSLLSMGRIDHDIHTLEKRAELRSRCPSPPKQQ